jgi:hypothetical protein
MNQRPIKSASALGHKSYSVEALMLAKRLPGNNSNQPMGTHSAQTNAKPISQAPPGHVPLTKAARITETTLANTKTGTMCSA